MDKSTLYGGIAIIAVLIIGAFLFTQFGDGRSEVEKQVLTAPDVTDTVAVQEYEETIAEVAVKTSTLEVGTRCEMTPLVIEISEGVPLTIKNNDSVSHTITFEDQSFFSVSGGRSREINIMEIFGKGEGTYRYRCNDVSSDENVGVMYVTTP